MDEDFEQAEAGASLTYPAPAGSVRKGGFAVLKKRPCKIVETSTSKTGKHGHAKVHLVGLDIFTSRKYEELCPSTHNMLIPVVKRADFLLCDITEDDYLSIMLDDGSTREDLKLPSGDIGNRIRAAFDDGKEVSVTVQGAMGEESVINLKEGQN